MSASPPASERVFDLLSTPRTTNESHEQTGVTRQRIDQILTHLIEEGKARRYMRNAGRARHLYIRADVEDAAIPPVRSLGSARDSAQTALYRYSIAGHLKKLSEQGLASAVKAGHSWHASLTPHMRKRVMNA